MDWIYYAIETTEEFFPSCRNCTRVFTHSYVENDGYFCVGIVRFPLKDFPFDVIRLCSHGSIDGDELFQHNYAPDEALNVADLLTQATVEWLVYNKVYDKFRNPEPNNTTEAHRKPLIFTK